METTAPPSMLLERYAYDRVASRDTAGGIWQLSYAGGMAPTPPLALLALAPAGTRMALHSLMQLSHPRDRYVWGRARVRAGGRARARAAGGSG